jgi:hypothetical protein
LNVGRSRYFQTLYAVNSILCVAKTIFVIIWLV